MEVLIIYTSYSGSNHFVAEAIYNQLKTKYTVTYKQADQTTIKDLEKADLILMGAPSWTFDGKEGQPSSPMSKLLQKAESLNLENKQFALFGCGDSSYTYLCGAVDVMEQFVHKTNATLALESLRIDKFYDNYDHNIQLAQQWASKIIPAAAN